MRSAGVVLDRTAPLVSDEAALVAELKAGSEEAFAYLLAIYQNPLFNLISHMVAEHGDAADVLQNVLLKVLRGIRQFNGRSSLKTWIYRIAVHEASNHRRSWRRRLVHEPFSVDDETLHLGMHSSIYKKSGRETPYSVYEKAECQAEVTHALADLAEPYRAVVVLREIEGLSYDEIAEVLGVAEGTVKSRLRRGRETLKRKLAARLSRSI
ncbi:MAG: sigma-70 family RNA polymerase sigma factor [Acidobacteria bacterium]|nr:MAG: sigma-70 family RNA polymerase sigma factor [Acidobacteriota bacterium]